MIRTLYTLIIWLAFAGINAGAADIPEDKEVIRFEQSAMGTVTFLHAMHAGMEGVECTTCHHTIQGDEPPQDCHNCHKDRGSYAPKTIKAFHTRCRGCHQYTVEEGKTAGPVSKCGLCHEN